VTVSELRLRTPQHRVSRKALLWWTLRAVVQLAGLIIVQVVLLLFVDDLADLLHWTLPITAGLAVLYAVVMPQWRYRVHRWEFTELAVYTLTGWFSQEWRVAPVSRIQTVDTERGPLQQLLGLATVTVTTASAAGPLEIAGLAHDDAVRLVDELTETTQATRGDAT
jgi:membrane protein YdbS with pleckstrin-like domain